MLNANTHVNVLSQQLVGGLVLLDRVVVDAAGGEGRAEEEAEETSTRANSMLASILDQGEPKAERKTYPPLKAPIGLLA
jgi:hypothetical protein